jgi:hypothetical protein
LIRAGPAPPLPLGGRCEPAWLPLPTLRQQLISASMARREDGMALNTPGTMEAAAIAAPRRPG